MANLRVTKFEFEFEFELGPALTGSGVLYPSLETSSSASQS